MGVDGGAGVKEEEEWGEEVKEEEGSGEVDLRTGEKKNLKYGMSSYLQDIMTVANKYSYYEGDKRLVQKLTRGW